MVKQKITTHLQRSLARHLGSCSYVKRLLQYSQSKNKTTTRYFAHSPRALALTSHLLSTHLSSSHYSSTLARTTLGGTLLLLSLHLASCFSSLLLGMSVSLMPCISGLHVYITCMLCISYLLRTRFPTVLVHFSSRASCHYALTSYHTLHFILYLYSVLLGRARSAVVLQRLPYIRCLLFCSAHALQLSRTGYESESPTNSGVIEDTGNSTCAVYCVGYEEGRGGIQKCCVCWKG